MELDTSKEKLNLRIKRVFFSLEEAVNTVNAWTYILFFIVIGAALTMAFGVWRKMKTYEKKHFL